MVVLSHLRLLYIVTRVSRRYPFTRMSGRRQREITYRRIRFSRFNRIANRVLLRNQEADCHQETKKMLTVRINLNVRRLGFEISTLSAANLAVPRLLRV